MTEISEAALASACKLLDEAEREFELRNFIYNGRGYSPQAVALARVLQEHSDVAKDLKRCLGPIGEKIGYHMTRGMDRWLGTLLLPDEPDPLVVAWRAAWPESLKQDAHAKMLREALDAAGYEIRRKDRG